MNPSIYDNEELWEELNRRSMARFNNRLTDESRKRGELRPYAYE